MSNNEETTVQKVAVIPEAVFNALVEYLLSRPYGEVSQLIDAIKESARVIDAPQTETRNVEVVDMSQQEPDQVKDVSKEQGGTI
jgi:hypothetical protein